MRRLHGSALPETVVALGVLVLVLTGGVDAARALGTAWGLQRAVHEAAWDVMINGPAANPAAWPALAQVPLFAGTGLTLSPSPANPAAWTYGTQVCVTGQAAWQAVSPYLTGLGRTFQARRCVYVQRWPNP